MASTAVPQRSLLKRTVTSTTADSSPSTAAGSPSDTPRQSPSSTSLSSMSSLDDVNDKGYGELLDTYGNKFDLPDYTVNDIRNAIPKHCLQLPSTFSTDSSLPRTFLRLPFDMCFGSSIPLSKVFSVPVFGFSLTNAAINLSPSPKSSTIRPAGSATQHFLSHTSPGRFPTANTTKPQAIWSVTWFLFPRLESNMLIASAR